MSKFKEIVKQRTADDITSANLSVSHNYRRAMSNPLIRIDSAQQEDNKMVSRSLPTELIGRSKEIKSPRSIDNRLSSLLLRALYVPLKTESDGLSSDRSRRISKTPIVSAKTPTKHNVIKLKKKIKNPNSIETPSLMRSEMSVQEAIRPIDDYPLYRIINDAIGDVAGLMNANILKKKGKYPEFPVLTHTESLTESVADDTTLNLLSQESEIVVSEATLMSKGLNINLKPLPSQLNNYLKSKCSLWRLQNKVRPSIPTSLSVNATSEYKEESVTEPKVVADEDEAKVKNEPNNNSKLTKVLMAECTARNTIYRNIRKGIFPYRINPKDFPTVHKADVRNNRHYLQTLTGKDKVMLNMRPSMVTIHRLLVKKQLLLVEARQKKLEENETKRLRRLQVQGVVSENYDEIEGATDNNKLSEKPHLTYNSHRPIFNENPNANNYRCIVKQINREVILKDKEEEDVASIGDVSFLSSTSSYEKNVAEGYDFNDKARTSNTSVISSKSSVPPDHLKCRQYVLTLNDHLNTMDKENRLANIYEASEPLMVYRDKVSNKPSLSSQNADNLS